MLSHGPGLFISKASVCSGLATLKHTLDPNVVKKRLLLNALRFLSARSSPLPVNGNPSVGLVSMCQGDAIGL